jgi:hypothetical protein
MIKAPAKKAGAFIIWCRQKAKVIKIKVLVLISQFDAYP